MKPIGGYFELADREQGEFIHKHGVLLNTGRNALEWILLSLGKARKVYLPYYTCDVVLEPLKRQNISWQFYRINERLEVDEEVCLGKDEYIIVNNYYGIKDAYIDQIVAKYGSKIIVDCAQAFFAPVLPGMKMFYSPRKFVGVADGGIAYGVTSSLTELEEDVSYLHSAHLFIRKELGAEEGFASYRKDEDCLDNQKVKRISSFTEDILNHIDYQEIVRKRRVNYQILEEALDSSNLLTLPTFESFNAPMAYPYMVENGAVLRKKLIANKVFVPRFWPNECIPNAIVGGKNLSETILPLPIDQRYGEEEMERIVQVIKR